MSESLWDADEVPQVKKHKPRRRAASAPVAAQAVQPSRPTFQARAGQRDFGIEFAIRNLGNAGMLRPEDYQENLHIIRPGLDADAQSEMQAWKVRNGLA